MTIKTQGNLVFEYRNTEKEINKIIAQFNEALEKDLDSFLIVDEFFQIKFTQPLRYYGLEIEYLGWREPKNK